MNYSNAMELLSASRLGVILVSEDLRILDANSSAEKLLENRLPLKGRSLSEAAPFLLSPDSEGRCINAGFRRYLRLSPCPEGIEVPVGTRLICFEEISGDVFRHILETIVNLICEPMILTDTEQRVLFINNATMRMESLLPEEVLGKKITEIYPSAQTNSSNFSFNELTVPHILRTREPLVNCRQQYTTVHGKQMDISCSSYPVFYGGDICGVFCLTADLSRAEELSKRVIELQGQLLKKSGSAAARTGGSRQNRLSAKYSFRDIIFQSRIATGYTWRRFLLVNVLGPGIFSIVWFIAFGGNAIFADAFKNAGIGQKVAEGGVPIANYALLQTLPLSAIMIPLVVAALFFGFVTLADAMTGTLSSMSLIGCKDDEAPVHMKLIWGIIVGLDTFLCLFCLGTGGTTALQFMSVIFGLPIFIATFAVICRLPKMCSLKLDKEIEDLPPENKQNLLDGKPFSEIMPHAESQPACSSDR